MGGPGGDATNPEELFAAGYAACFESALRLVARKQQIPVAQASVTARVALCLTEQKTYELAAELRVKLPEVERAQALGLVELAHQVCPYSVATRGNVDVQISLV